MTLTSLSSTPAAYPESQPSEFKQRMQDFKALKTALQSGDLAAAQKAFAAVQQDVKPSTPPAGSTTPAGTAPANQWSTDFQAIGSALQSGDITGAQKAFATLRQDMQAAHQAQGSRGHRHHHHHVNNDANSTPTSTSPDTTGTTASTDTSTVGRLLNSQA